jgi:hypothetical protein
MMISGFGPLRLATTVSEPKVFEVLHKQATASKMVAASLHPFPVITAAFRRDSVLRELIRLHSM